MVKEAEGILGVELPAAFIALLRIQNGGYTRGFVFPTTIRTSWAEDHVPLNELFGIGGKELSLVGGHNILDTGYMTKEWGLPTKQVLLAGDGHWWITLDYRMSNVPSVSWIDVEVDEDMLLARSFEDFLAGILPTEAVDPKTSRLKIRS